MGRRRGSDPGYARWRRAFRKSLVARYGEQFTAEAMQVLDGEVEAFGDGGPEGWALLEAIVPGLTRNLRRGGGGATR